METTPTSREKDTSGREEWHEEDKRKVKKLYSSFLPVRVLTGMGWGRCAGYIVRFTGVWKRYGRKNLQLGDLVI